MDSGVISKFLGFCWLAGLLWRESVALASVHSRPSHLTASSSERRRNNTTYAQQSPHTTPIPPTLTNNSPSRLLTKPEPTSTGKSALRGHLAPCVPVLASCHADIWTPPSQHVRRPHRPRHPMTAPSIILHFLRLRHEYLADHVTRLQIPARAPQLLVNTLSTSPPIRARL